MAGDSSLGSELLEPREQQVANYSGKIVEQNQARIDGILAARAIGIPIRKIMQAFTVSPHTIAAIEARHATKLATLKDRLARKFGVFLELGLDRAISTVNHMDVDKLMVSLGIAADKLQVLTGEPSVIVGTGDGPRTFNIETLNARLGRREKPVDADYTDLPTGSAGGKDSPTRATAAPALYQPSKPAASDAASEV